MPILPRDLITRTSAPMPLRPPPARRIRRSVPPGIPGGGGIPTEAYRAHVLATVPGLLAYWPLDGEADDLLDLSGNAADATIVGDCPIDLSGPSVPGGGAREFQNSVNSRMTAAVANNATRMFVACWIKPDSTETNAGVMGRWAANTGFVTAINSGNLQVFVQGQAAVGGVTAPLTNDVWQFMAVAVGTIGTDEALGWVGNELKFSDAGSRAIGTGGTAFEIGSYSNAAATTYFDGRIAHAIVATGTGLDSFAECQAVVDALVAGP